MGRNVDRVRQRLTERDTHRERQGQIGDRERLGEAHSS